MVSDGVIPALQSFLDCKNIDPEASQQVQRAMNYLYSYFCHTYLTLFQHQPLSSAPKKRKQDNSDWYDGSGDSREEVKKRASVRVEYCEEVNLVSIEIDENTHRVRFS